mmetsp:Transcript_19008/g.39115  ORF Transcript_19008/g.39115 Transcript_19008/m.39115 type:complete len:110 (-) Transcript_19008:55-384(-)
MGSHNALFAKSTSADMRAPVRPSVMRFYARFVTRGRILRTSSQTRGPLIRLPPKSQRSCIPASESKNGSESKNDYIADGEPVRVESGHPIETARTKRVTLTIFHHFYTH